MRQDLAQFGTKSSERARRLGIAEGGGQVSFRSQIDLQRFRLVPVRRNLQNRGTAKAAMRDQHLLTKLLAVTGSDDLGGNSGQITVASAVFLLQDQRHKARPRS